MEHGADSYSVYVDVSELARRTNSHTKNTYQQTSNPNPHEHNSKRLEQLRRSAALRLQASNFKHVVSMFVFAFLQHWIPYSGRRGGHRAHTTQNSGVLGRISQE